MIKQSVSGILHNVKSNQIYSIKRQEHLASFPGYVAFLGGKVNPDDASLEAALLREVQEELFADGANKQEFLQSIQKIYHLGEAVTPAFTSDRYSNHYFVIEVDGDKLPKFVLDEGEILWGQWGSCEDFHQRYLRGEIMLAPPTRQIFALGLSEKTQKNLTYTWPKDECALIWPLHGVGQILVPSNTLPPNQLTNSFLIGDDSGEGRILVDPSPRDELSYQQLLKVVRKFKISKIFITHHHPDHNQFADYLAREIQVPISLSEDTRTRLCAREGCDLFKKIPLEIVEHQFPIGQWLGEKILTFAVPGHDEGHMALYVPSGKWMIVGDLYQGMGTVVVAKPEGNMQKYFSSLKNVMALNPQHIFPSHGLGAGGTWPLKRTLEHREKREEEILQHFSSTKDLDELLIKIYPELPEELKIFARMNIESHLEKLRLEGKI